MDEIHSLCLFAINHALFWGVGGGGGAGRHQFCDVVAKVAIGPDEDLAKFGYMLNKKIKFLYNPSIILATYLKHTQKFADFFSILVELWLLKISKDT
jgi:hypothetical protein